MNIFDDGLLRYEFSETGKDKATIRLERLYKNNGELSAFQSRWRDFFKSDDANGGVFELSSGRLSYSTESVVPVTRDHRISLLLLFGNPAPHSIKAGAMFSYEGKSKEHRIWKVLRSVGLLSVEASDSSHDTVSQAVERIKSIIQLRYESRFRVAFASFISFPSTPSDPRWSGVAGVARLFGSRAFQELCNSERKRISLLVKNHVEGRGIILAFQKIAYNEMRHERAERFSLQSCMRSELIGYFGESGDVVLASVPPTRFLLGHTALSALSTSLSKAEALLQKIRL